ncbi:hypothetical protein NE865_08461 [Phthorimaea operculella]|nr:hypothetical protein NE865_08461 [Phthorimaea operculella]
MGFLRAVIHVIPLVLVTVHSRSIADSDHNVTKSDTQDDLFPDWVPFKNKHGEQLGEFLQVETPSKKPKKRLAPPVNFLLRSVADAEPEEYFERGMGDTYGEDYTDKRDWGDTLALDEERRESEARKALILGAVDELKERHALEQKAIMEKVKEEAMYAEERERDNLQSDIFNKYGQKLRVQPKDYDEFEGKYEDKYKITPLRRTTPPPAPTETTTYETSTVVTTKRAPQTGKMSVFRNPHIYMIYDDEDTTTESSTTALSSSSTDTSASDSGSSSSSASSEETRLTPKFDVKFIAPTRVSSNETERISLVPQDEELREGEPTLFFPQKLKRKSQNKSRYQKEKSDDINITSSSEENLPHNDARSAGYESAGPETAPSAPSSSTSRDSLASASAFDNTGPSSIDSSQLSSAQNSAESKSIQTGPSSSGETAASASAEATAPAEVTGPPTDRVHPDVVSASTDVKEEKKIEEDHEHEKGGEKEHHSEYHSEHGEGGKKGYEAITTSSRRQLWIPKYTMPTIKAKPWYYSVSNGFHEDEKTEKGHHDKEDHEGKYHDHGGVDKEHHDERKHYGTHHHEEHGKKHAEYEESGKHSKGHSTKGSHDIHKKEEYEKNVEFFEEEGDSAEEEKHGGHHEERGHKKDIFHLQKPEKPRYLLLTLDSHQEPAEA